MMRIKHGFVIGLVMMAACGGEAKKAPGGGGAGTAAAGGGGAAELAVPPLGVDALKKMNYPYGAGQKEYAKVIAAYKAKPIDWAAVKTAAEATLAKDGDHLEARWALGEALANTGDAAKATEHLAAALAGDWLRWGPTLAQDAELATYLGTAQGKQLVALSDKLRPLVIEAIAKGPVIVGRRSTWKSPKPGTGYAATRGELYAYDLAGKRYLRVTHTDHTLAGVVASPSGEWLLVGFSEAEVPDPAKAKPGAAPLLTRSWVSAWDPKSLTETAARAKIGKARFVWAGWGAGEQVVVMTATASGRWAPGAFTTYVVDRSTGKLTKTAGATIDGPRVQMSLDEVIDGATASLPAAIDPAIADKLLAAIEHDDRGQPRLAAAALSPGGGRIAYASATDPCAKADDAAKPSLYVGDARTGAYKHVLTAASRFGLRWIDDDRLIYEDGSGGLRIYDAAAGRESGKITERAGLAVALLSPGAAPLCTTDPPVADEPAPDELPEEISDEAMLEGGPADDPATP